MNKLLLVLFFTCHFITSMGQDKFSNDAALEGRMIDVELFYPLADDSILNRSKIPIIYPLLIVNDVIIRDIELINCFRRSIDKSKIRKIKYLVKEKADRKGIPDVPKDGVLLITTKKSYSFAMDSIVVNADSCKLKSARFR